MKIERIRAEDIPDRGNYAKWVEAIDSLSPGEAIKISCADKREALKTYNSIRATAARRQARLGVVRRGADIYLSLPVANGTAA